MDSPYIPFYSCWIFHYIKLYRSIIYITVTTLSAGGLFLIFFVLIMTSWTKSFIFYTLSLTFILWNRINRSKSVNILKILAHTGQDKGVCTAVSMRSTEFILVWLLINYYIISQTTNCKPTFAHRAPCRAGDAVLLESSRWACLLYHALADVIVI